MPPPIKASKPSGTVSTSAAIAGFRLTHLIVLSHIGTGRAAMGSPAPQRSRSSARAAAELYRRDGSF